ncbi:MAG: hypothetical protein QCI38_04080 [Candidatus Thermoplasmatota archaeon]|nr:hypothetical protein [Candidatus Thermoplasmatota archaeon]
MEKMAQCPRCGNQMGYVQHYSQWYCDFCRQYAPQQPPPGTIQCPRCRGWARHVPQYGRFYCDACRTFIQPPPANAGPQQPSQPPQAPPSPRQTQPPRDLNLALVAHALEHGTTVGDKSSKTVVFLPDESPRSLGVWKLERDMTRCNMTMFKGEMFITQYRLVFVEKTSLLEPNWMSFWFNVDYGGKLFQVEKGGRVHECKGTFLEMELKKVIKSVDTRLRYVRLDNNLVPITILDHPVKIYKADMYDFLLQARNAARPIPATRIQEYLYMTKDPSGRYTFGPWDSALGRAIRDQT